MGNDDLLGGASEGFFESQDSGADLFGDTSVSAEPESNDLTQDLSLDTGEMSKPAAVAPSAKPQQDGYVVLARKYRPQTFDDIVGQEGVQKALRGAIATGQISHAYLFSGPRGTGKTSTARILAKALNCQENGPRPDPCGKCSSCRSITAGSSLDVIEIDAASNTGVDNIRELKSGVVLAPFSRYKVYIVDEVHMLSNQAFNALLKTLEEPPPQVIFVLATTELHKVPETIISRCSTFMFKRFTLDELKNQLGSILDIETKQRQLAMTPEDREKILDLVSRNAEGGMRDAQVTLDQVLVLSKGIVDFESVRRFLGMADIVALDSFVKFLNDRKARELLELIDSMVADGQDLELFLKGACEHMRDLLLVQCAGRDTSLINVSEDRALELELTAKQLSSSFLIKSIDHLLKVVGEMKISGQPRTILELAVLKLTLTDEGDQIQNILQRLDNLEKGSPSAPAEPVISSGTVGYPATAQTRPPVSRMQASEGMSPPPVDPGPRSIEPPVTSTREVSGEDNIPEMAPEAVKSSADLNASGIDADNIVARLRNRLQQEMAMVSMAFEKSVCGQRMEGRVLVLSLNENLPMPSQQLMRPQTTAQIAGLVKDIAGDAISVRMELKAGEEMTGDRGTVASETVTKPHQANIVAQPTALATDVTVQRDTPPIADIVNDEPSDLKIYYPEEIREKTMVELKAAEFQNLLSVDEKLKELVERTREVFGIDESRMKFHRSTLA